MVMEYAGVVAEMILVVCLLTAVSDAMMNGMREADWAPWGLGIAFLCIAFLLLIGWE